VSVLATRTEQHPVRWLTAAPLWGGLLTDDDPSPAAITRMHRPALLRLQSDDFMDELAATLADDPAGLASLEAKRKSFRAPPPGASSAYEPPIDHIKLYQPAHGHFNLVAATLVCRIAGLPDKAVDAAGQEAVAFLLRRVAKDGELAWDGSTWTPAGDETELVAGETEYPMFPLAYEASGRARRLFLGLIPTASSDSFKSGGAVTFSPQPGDREGPPPDRRLEDLERIVVDQLTAIDLRPSSEDLVDVSRFLLLDLGAFLQEHIGPLWTAVQVRQRPAPGALQSAYDLLNNTYADSTRGHSWITALNGVWAERLRIWGEPGEPDPAFVVNLVHSQMSPAGLESALTAALPPRTAAQQQEPQPPFEAPKLDPRPSVRYVVRCVYRRPCCGPLHADVVSDATDPFAIAGFFDFDAPARPIHISLPLDTSIAGLRKSPKNVRILLSNELRGQLGRIKDAKKALDAQIDEGESVDLGMICSFSIPIITICALLVLMIFLILLNIVFWWLPFFRICFPVPLKGKG
jgi:hypothetical protein